jgi:hypothetical protein
MQTKTKVPAPKAFDEVKASQCTDINKSASAFIGNIGSLN